MGYASCAERIYGGDTGFLESNPPIVPIFVSLLFQSLEISIKHAGIESGLFTEFEARSRDMSSGHGIGKLAQMAVEKLGGDPFSPLVMAMTHFNANPHSRDVVNRMICGADMQNTRNCYASRCLGYGQVADGDFAIIYPLSDWIETVKETASNLPKTIDIFTQWKRSTSGSKHFAIWVKGSAEGGVPQVSLEYQQVTNKICEDTGA